jgi:short-chain fatty acids transporter
MTIAQTGDQIAPAGWLDRFAVFVAHVVPDAITASVILLLVLVLAALSLGNSPTQVMDAYYRGLWMLLPFTMQMTLIIVLSSALASTPFFQGAVMRMSGFPRTGNQMVALAVLLTASAAYAYWGLGIALSPLIAVHFAREAERKGIAVDFPFLLGLIVAANATWQFGLSASAPLLVATPGHFLEQTIGVIPLARTIWSPAAIVHEVTFTAGIIFAGCWLMPRKARPISYFPESSKVAEPAGTKASLVLTGSERLESKPYFPLLLAAVLLVWLWYHFGVRRLSLDINSLNTTLLLLNVLLHRNFRNFTAALEKAVVASWPVIVLYHLYAGLAGLIQYTSVGEKLAGMAAAVSGPYTYPTLTAAIATVFAFFIPSSGGQWAIQGFITAKSAMEVGVSVERGLLAMSVGDHMGNLTSPFWYVVIAGIARLDFRIFFGYGLLFAALWFLIGVVVFTFAPC